MAMISVHGGGSPLPKRYRWKKYQVKQYLYKDGDEYTSLTGGFEAITAHGSMWTKNSRTLYGYDTDTSGSFKAIDTVNTIDVTDYDSIVIVGTNGNASRCATAFAMPVRDPSGQSMTYQKAFSVAGAETISIDVSSVTGSWYIGVGVSTSGSNISSCTINEIYLAGGKQYVEDVVSEFPNTYPDGYDEAGDYYYERVDGDQYFYKDGTFYMPFDATSRAMQSGFTCDGTWTQNTSSLTARCTGTNHNRVLMSDELLDLSLYDYAVIEYNGQLSYLNISSVSEGYLALTYYYNGNTYIRLDILNSKISNYLTNNIAAGTYISISTSSSSLVTVTKIWLEKALEYYPAVDSSTPYQYKWNKYQVKKYLYKDGNITQSQLIPTLSANNENILTNFEERSGYELYKAFDQNTSTWCDPINYTLTSSHPYVGYNFGSIKHIAHIKFIIYTTTGYTYKIAVEASSDLENWEAVTSEYSCTGDGTYEFDCNIDTQAVRLRVTDGPEYVTLINSYAIHFAELQVYNTVCDPIDEYAVAWDNTGYARGSSYSADGGFALDSTYITATMTSTAKHGRTILINEVINLSKYSTLKFLYDNTTEYSVDISSVVVPAYIGFETLYDASNYYFDYFVTNQETNYLDNKISYAIVKSSTSTFAPIINQVYLEGKEYLETLTSTKEDAYQEGLDPTGCYYYERVDNLNEHQDILNSGVAAIDMYQEIGIYNKSTSPITSTDDGLRLTALTSNSNYYAQAIATFGPVDVTNYNNLYIKVIRPYADYNLYVSYSASIPAAGTNEGIPSGTTSLQKIDSASTQTIGIYNIDVSALTGSIYLNFEQDAYTTECYSILQDIYLEDSRTYLFKDGNECTAITSGWSNEYKMNSSGLTHYSAYVTNIGMNCSLELSGTSEVSMVTQVPIDLSKYNTLHVLYNSTTAVSLDISSLTGYGYIGAGKYISSSKYYTMFAVSSARSEWNTNRYLYIADALSSYALTINRIWLE